MIREQHQEPFDKLKPRVKTTFQDWRSFNPLKLNSHAADWELSDGFQKGSLLRPYTDERWERGGSQRAQGAPWATQPLANGAMAWHLVADRLVAWI